MTGRALQPVKAAIYARFSTDKQHDRSIDDQVVDCTKYARRNDFEIAGVYHDKAMSGASFLGRTGLQALLADAERGKFQVVIAESMSRIGRDDEFRAHIRKRLAFLGIKMMTPADGVVSTLVDQIRGSPIASTSSILARPCAAATLASPAMVAIRAGEPMAID